MIATHTTFGAQALGYRARQEDALKWGRRDARWRWAVIADGLGGHARGDEAAHTAVAVLAKHSTDAPFSHPDGISTWMEAGILAAHRAVMHLATHEVLPPGSTALWVLADATQIWIAHVGDSRAYLVRPDVVVPLTVDMTPAGERVEQGRAPWDSQNTAADGHLLTACLGLAPLKVDVFSVPWRAGDAVVLTSDGLNGVDLATWRQVVQRPKALTALLEAEMWPDNATAVVMPHE